MKGFCYLLACALMLSCTKKSGPITYRVTLEIDGSLKLPFLLRADTAKDNYSIINGDEEIEGLLISRVDDSIDLEHPVFNASLRFAQGDTLKGYWYNREKGNYRMPFTAVKSSSRFVQKPNSQLELPQKWKVVFEEGPDQYPAVGVFNSNQGSVTGTFLTETGDYRYLDGIITDTTLLLSTFDMSHAFLFKATISANQMSGQFYSGKHYSCNWTGYADDNALLTPAQELVDKLPSVELDFQIVSLNGEPISLSDSRYRNQAVIVQLFGSWCPNCYDESLYLKEIYPQLLEDSIHLLGVGFEKSADSSLALAKIQKFQKGLAIPYALAYGGVANKDTAQKVFPFLNKVVAFPTLLFFNPQHELIAIHSGFSGPGTGNYYLQTKDEIDSLIASLKEE